ncbi:MAG: HD domain-containing phosphohydrolase [Anaerolineae bacterium]
MEKREQMDKLLPDLIEIIHFTENVSAKIHGMLDEAEIYRTVKEEFAKSKRYTASILLLTDDGSKLRIAETSLPPEKLKAGEKAARLRLKGYRIDLDKSSTYSRIVREGKTVQSNVSDIIGELFPQPLAYLISKTMGYEEKNSILTPLKRYGKIIGAFAMTSPELAEHLIPSVRNLAQHISTALELADAHAESRRAEEELRKYHDHLEELVEKRTAELIQANEQLQREITERKRAEEALELKVEQLAALSQASQVVTASLELDQVLAEIVSLASEVVSTDYTSVVLVDEAGNIGRSAENLPGVPGIEYRIRDKGLTRWIVHSRQAGVIDEIGEDGAMIPDLGEGAPRFANPPIVEAGVKSVAGLPLMVKDRLLGVLYLHSLRAGAFHGQLPLLTTFANQVAIAVDNARLYEALWKSEERFKRIARATNDAIWDLDLVTNAVWWNEGVKTLFGYRANEVGYDPMWWREHIHPEDRERVVSGINAVINGGEEFWSDEYRYQRADGSYAHVFDRGYVLYDDSGKPVRMVGGIVDITERKRVEEELRQSFQKLRRAFEGTVNALVSAIEIRDPYTAGHQRGVTQLACAIAKEMGLPEEQIEGIRMAGLIHDLGKINVPAEILSKPGPLTELEYGLIKMHPQIGHDVLNGVIEFPWPVAQIVLQHHERMDGSGYPEGLAGEEILLEARILAVADVVEAMASSRPYREPRGIDEALGEISQNRGVLYDPEVVDACLKLFTEKGFKFT